MSATSQISEEQLLTDKSDRQQLSQDVDKERIELIYKGKSPLESVSLWSRVLFSWTYPMIRYARSHQLNLDFMGEISKDDRVEVQVEKLRKSWQQYRNQQDQQNHLFRAVIHAYKHEYNVAMFWNIIVALLQLSSPFILHRLIIFIKEQQPNTAGGITLVMLLVLTQGIAYVISEHLKFYQRMIGCKQTNAMVALVYEKQFKISTATNKRFSSGEMVNFVQVDAMKLQLFSQTLPYVMRLPVLLVICFIILFAYLGKSFFAGLLVFVIAFITNLSLGRIQAKLQKVFMKKQDARINTTNESLNNIKMLKLYSWTHIFSKVIESKRFDELAILWTRFKYGQLVVTSLYFFPQILSAVIFSVYIGTGHTLDLSVAFTVMTILNLLQDPLRTLPMFLGQVIEFLISMRRIQDYLKLNEINETVIQQIDKEQTQEAIEIWSGNFHWGLKLRSDVETNQALIITEVMDAENERLTREPKLKDFLALKQVDLKIKQGEFVCIIGDVASGKSSLLNSIIGDLMYCNPLFMIAHGESELNEDLKQEVIEHSQIPVPESEAPIRLSENVSYVQQQPWIQNKSIRENILFGLPFDEDKYKETIKICELKRDLQILPAGDQTEIGEKGINLSGGQKARVGLARAVYSDREIYLMDDPISALDANVKKKIFKNVFMSKFNKKTRVLVTHAIDFLHLVDSIILLKQGRVVFKGSYEQVKTNAYLTELVAIHHSHQTLKPDSGLQQPLIDIELIESEQGIKPVDINDISESSVSESDEETKNEEKPARPTKKRERSYSITIGDLSENDKKLKGQITTNENDEESRVSFGVYRDFNNYCGGSKQLLLTNLTMTGFIVTKVACDWLVGQWSTSPDQHSRFAFYCSGQFILSTLCSGFVGLRVFCLQYYSWRGTKQLHQDMIEKVLNAPINLYFDTTPIGRIMNRFSKDLQLIETMLNYQVGGLYVATYLLISIVVIAIWVVPWVTIIFPVMLICVFVLYKLAIDATKEVSRIESVSKSPLLAFLTESISGSSTIRAFQRRNDFIEHNNNILNRNILACQWSEAVPLWFMVRVDLVALFTMAAISIFCITARFQGDSIMLSLLLTYILNLQIIVISVVRQLMDIEARMVNVERLLSLLKVPQELIDGQKASAGWPQKGEVDFQDVVLRYRPTTEIVLDKLTFKALPGEKIGVVGRTGAGKSTICLSLSRIVEIVEGSIFIDGVDISKLDLNYLRASITVIPQDPTMFTGTLRFNLDPENSCSDDRILEVLKKATLDDLLRREDKGLLMELTENGQNLSSGERQLICICRAILRSSKVVILDEATANIDVVTEQKIQTLIQAEFKESTMITIAHRLNTIIQSDKVMVLSFGKILEYDTPKNLMSDQESHFSQLLQEIEKEEKKQK